MLRDLFSLAPARVRRGAFNRNGKDHGPRLGTLPGRRANASERRLAGALLLAAAVVALAGGLRLAHAADAPPPPAPAATPATTPATVTAKPTTAGSKKRYFKTELSWANNTYYTPSQASGHAEFELDIDTHKVRWILTFKDLSSPPTKVSLHAPAQPGATGAAILDLAPQGLKSPAQGEGQLSDAQVEYLLTGWSYALVTTRKYPQGEARGQLDRVRTATPAFAQAQP